MPFTLTHPKPEPVYENDSKSSDIKTENSTEKKIEKTITNNKNGTDDTTGPIDHNLIELM